MPLPFKRTELTLEARAAEASAMATTHLSAFEQAASGLEKVANDLDQVREAAHEEATRHLAIKINADNAAFQHRAQAQKIRDLLL